MNNANDAALRRHLKLRAKPRRKRPQPTLDVVVIQYLRAGLRETSDDASSTSNHCGGDRYDDAAARHIDRRALTRLPVTAHAWHDHRAARPIFLHIGGRAYAHGIGTGIVARIDIIGPLVETRRDMEPGRWRAQVVA